MNEEHKIDPLQFDKRVIHRFIKNGELSELDIKNYLEKLPDLKDESDDAITKNYVEKRGNINR